MTNVMRSMRTTIEHRFVVPCEEPWAGTWDDFGVARTWAEKKAEALGINTDFADWSRIHLEDDHLVIVLTEKSAIAPVTTDVALDAAYDEICAVIDRAKTDDRSLDTDEYAGMIVDAVKKAGR